MIYFSMVIIHKPRKPKKRYPNDRNVFLNSVSIMKMCFGNFYGNVGAT